MSGIRPADDSPHDNDPDDDAADDAALSWEGDEELGRATSLTNPNPESVPAPAATRSTAAGATTAEADEEPEARDVPRLIVTAIFALGYLAFTVGWVLAIQAVGGIVGVSTGIAALDFVARIAQFLALISCPLWFASVLQLTRDSRLGVRVGWLALGLGLLIPWPFLIGVIA